MYVQAWFADDPEPIDQKGVGRPRRTMNRPSVVIALAAALLIGVGFGFGA
jgi:hypothetical protein